MAVKLRLQRWGQHKKAFYRIVAADSKARRDGNFVERIGTYDPMIDDTGRKRISFNYERAKYWLGVGAQPTDTVARLLHFAGIIPQPPFRERPIASIPNEKKES
ncbi:ribosomal protein S16 domain-containing protein [Pavlovales sp. CCMP2436]|nr:ribosomal protein S16 domain-containing protein [Pavlovales sp. CCMP2436]